MAQYMSSSEGKMSPTNHFSQSITPTPILSPVRQRLINHQIVHHTLPNANTSLQKNLQITPRVSRHVALMYVVPLEKKKKKEKTTATRYALYNTQFFPSKQERKKEKNNHTLVLQWIQCTTRPNNSGPTNQSPMLLDSSR